MYAAVIEWPDDHAESPKVIVGPDLDRVLCVVVEELVCRLTPEDYADDQGFLANNPYPDEDDATAVRTWLAAMREATTVPWVNTYRLTYEEDGTASSTPLVQPFEVAP